jgi:hypothetical protein
MRSAREYHKKIDFLVIHQSEKEKGEHYNGKNGKLLE